jgi:hypothetical protein
MGRGQSGPIRPEPPLFSRTGRIGRLQALAGCQGQGDPFAASPPGRARSGARPGDVGQQRPLASAFVVVAAVSAVPQLTVGRDDHQLRWTGFV